MRILAVSDLHFGLKQFDWVATQADAYDAIRQMQDMMPRRSQGFGEVVADLLDRRIKEIDDTPAAQGGAE